MSNLRLGEFDAGGVRGKKVSFSHLAIPVLDVERSIAFYEKYLQMKVVKRRENPIDVWMADGVRPFQLVLLAADKADIKDAARSGPTDYRNAKLAHPIVASAHIGFTCSSCSEAAVSSAIG
jgi:catechol 2,3-dioxygenase-like lactoylglutathione lyase family enzyme